MALAALAGLVFVTLLATCPSLHEVFHGHEASSPTHQCVASLLAKGDLLCATATDVLPVGPVLTLSSPRIPGRIFRSVDYRLSPSRAPPAGIL